ncbi:MAG: type IV secretory system conjugative DNA transfer family protein, partial [Acutalibacteraceae bacterium]
KNSAGEGEREDFFTASALELLTCISLYLFHSDNEVKSFGRVIRLVNSISYVNGKINPDCELSRCLSKFSATCENQDSSVLVSWRGMQNIPEETMGSIAKTLSTRLQLWALSDVDAFMDKDEMEFGKIGFEKTVIFLIIPAAKKTYKVIANLFYSQLFNELMRVAEAQPDGRLRYLVSLEIDEFANIGKIPDFPEILAVIRKYNIRACIVLQGLSQLKAIYEKTWDSIIGNCDIFTFLGSKDSETKKYVSEKLGNTTVRVDQRSYNRGSMQGGGGQDSENYVSRPLLYPDEIPKAVKAKGKSRKYGGKCFIWVGYNEPFYLDKYDTLSHPRIADCGSKYDVTLCTDIREVYGDIYEKRKSEYDKKKREEAKKLEELFDAPDNAEESADVGEPFDPEEIVEEYDDEQISDDVQLADELDAGFNPDFPLF